jgi:hypothetical protein
MRVLPPIISKQIETFAREPNHGRHKTDFDEVLD